MWHHFPRINSVLHNKNCASVQVRISIQTIEKPANYVLHTCMVGHNDCLCKKKSPCTLCVTEATTELVQPTFVCISNRSCHVNSQELNKPQIVLRACRKHLCNCSCYNTSERITNNEFAVQCWTQFLGMKHLNRTCFL